MKCRGPCSDLFLKASVRDSDDYAIDLGGTEYYSRPFSDAKLRPRRDRTMMMLELAWGITAKDFD